MLFTVNENCIGCGLCVELCPSVFSMNDDGLSQAIKEDVTPPLLAPAQDAAESCPVDAIEQH